MSNPLEPLDPPDTSKAGWGVEGWEDSGRGERILEHIREGFVALDGDGRVLRVNAAAEHIAGASRQDWLDRPWSEAVAGLAGSELDAAIRRAREERQPQKLLIDFTPWERWLEVRIFPEDDGTLSIYFCDVTDFKAMEEAVARTSEGPFRTLANSVPQLVWMARPDGYIFWYNQRWYDYTGTTFEEMKGWGWQSVHDAAELPRVVAKFRQSLATGGPWEDTFPLRRHDGEMRWHLSRMMPVRDERGDIVLYFGTNTDITERRQMEEALRESDRRKDAFLATLAHELRNPLAPLVYGLQIMQKAGGDAAAVARARAMMERQVGHLVQLVDDLLDVSRISLGKIELHQETLELASVLRSALETSQPLIAAGGHHLHLDLPSEPILVVADRLRLAQIFANLLNNAAKFTRSGGRIELEVKPAQENGWVLVTVRDNGVGIPPAMLPRIFDMFTQVDQSLEKAHGGLGIGLTLVKELVAMHGGTTEVYSAGPGRGSEFRVRLPVLEQPVPASASPAQAAVKSTARRILVADDNYDAALSLSIILEMKGHEVRLAQDGLEALEIAADFHPDVVLLDLGMPNLNGYDTCRRMRGEPWGADLLIIALTGWGQPEDRRRSREAGFDHHLVKPVEPSLVEDLLAEAKAGG